MCLPRLDGEEWYSAVFTLLFSVYFVRWFFLHLGFYGFFTVVFLGVGRVCVVGFSIRDQLKSLRTLSLSLSLSLSHV